MRLVDPAVEVSGANFEVVAAEGAAVDGLREMTVEIGVEIGTLIFVTVITMIEAVNAIAIATENGANQEISELVAHLSAARDHPPETSEIENARDHWE
jgi:hypothetical protein